MFLLIIYMIHWLSVRYLICLNQPCFNLRDIHQKACGLFFFCDHGIVLQSLKKHL